MEQDLRKYQEALQRLELAVPKFTESCRRLAEALLEYAEALKEEP